jgi:uncharacterized protein YqjF (DUF2071 family)
VSSFPSLTAVARQALALDETSHRPWPLPDGDWVQAQTREDVLFTHWRVDAAELARLLPPGLPADTHEGETWVGITPYRLTNLRLRGLPPLPRSFQQLDVRTYVTVDDRPGIWFVSIEASNALLAEAARRAHRLPAYRARISAGRSQPLRYDVERDGRAFRVTLGATGEPFAARPGSLGQFLSERYCIYAGDGGRLYRAELHHRPWQLQPVEATVEECTLAPVALIGEPHCLYAAAQDMLVWPLEEL